MKWKESGMSVVSLVKIRKKGMPALKQAILESLQLIKYSFRKEPKQVLIKPNLCYYWDYSTGQTTDPKFVGALIEVIREEVSPSATISIVESDASAMKCRHVFKMLGYEKLSQKYGVRLINLSEEESDPIQVTVEGHPFHLKVPRIIRDADLKINIPKIKYSTEKIKLTCALKNIFGCNPYQKKFRYHSRLEEAIVAVNKAMEFNLCLIDAGIVSGIQPRRLGLVMASEDPVAIDAAAAKIAGINPSTIRYLQMAQKEGLGNTSFIQRGERLDEFKRRYPRKTAKATLMGKAYELVLLMHLGKRLGLE